MCSEQLHLGRETHVELQFIVPSRPTKVHVEFTRVLAPLSYHDIGHKFDREARKTRSS